MNAPHHEDGRLFELPGGWTHRTLTLAGHTFQLILPAQPDSVLDAQLEADQGRSAEADQAAPDPYWAALWSSAIPTAETVLRADWRGDESVLELGCGVGLVGLAALACGLQVTLSDYVPQAVELALHNAQRNGYPTVCHLLLNWHHPPQLSPSERYSTLLASDVLYNQANHVPLLNTIDQLLTPHGVCWIGDPGRFHARAFHQLASDRFHVQLRDHQGRTFNVPVAGAFQMFVLRRRANEEVRG